MSDGLSVLVVVAVVVGQLVLVGFLGWLFLFRLRRPAGEALDRARDEVRDALAASQASFTAQLLQLGERTQGQLDSLTRQVAEQLKTTIEVSQRSSGRIDERLDKATSVIGDVKESLGKLSESNQRLFEVGKDVASLRELLRSPKLRGGLGELFLGDLLAEVLPRDRFRLQHEFKGGETVDAVVELGGRLVPIDAKFPLEAFGRLQEAKGDDERLKAKRELGKAFRKHVDGIASKYIRPSEGTLDFALLYIPAESVFYEVVTRDLGVPEEQDLATYALRRRVIPVSPTSFFAYLETILFGLSALRVEENAELVLAHLRELRDTFGRIEKDYETVGKHLQDAVNRFRGAQDALSRAGRTLSDLERLEAPEGGEGAAAGSTSGGDALPLG